ncbi:uncharacterized protein GJ701_000888 [Geothlypis trichas]
MEVFQACHNANVMTLNVRTVCEAPSHTCKSKYLLGVVICFSHCKFHKHMQHPIIPPSTMIILNRLGLGTKLQDSNIRIPSYLKLPFTEELMSTTLIFAWTPTERILAGLC